MLVTNIPRLQNTALGTRWRMKDEWNRLPLPLRQMNSLPRFKLRTKAWLKGLRTPEPGDVDTQDTMDH